jgi:polyferredoxin
MKLQLDRAKTVGMRALVQWLFFVWVLSIGVRFGFFVRHFESQATTLLVSRPTGVDGFLPIGALASLKYWLLTGDIDMFHPAALVLFLTFLTMSLLTKKSFCSWICPIGTLSEGLWMLGKRIFGRNFQMWHWLDFFLRGFKYLLLLFFVKILLLDMPVSALGEFLQTPYWAVSDVKMYHFFTGISLPALAVLVFLAGLSLLYKNVWCRYLCPYGALLGVISIFSPLKIRRDIHSCTNCGLCTNACPSHIQVQRKKTVRSPECTGCLSCVNSCPTTAVQMAPPLWKGTLPRWTFPVLILAIYFGGIAVGMATGHWTSSLSYEEYQRLIPLASFLNH